MLIVALYGMILEDADKSKYLDPEGTCSSDYNTYWRFRDNFLMRTI